MYFQVKDTVKQIKRSEIDPDFITAGFITLTELKAKADNFGFSPATVALCDQQNKYFRSSVYVYENYTFATIRITSAHKKNDKEDCVAIYISKNFFLVVDIVDSDHSTKNSFKKSLKRYPESGLTLEKIVFAFLDCLIEGDSHILEDIDFNISKLEASILKGKIDNNFSYNLAYYKRQVFLLRNYYEQLIDICEELLEDENDVFEGELKYLNLFKEKITRLTNNVLLLREELSGAREAHQSLLDSKMNSTMKTLTVLSSIFLPLTLVTSWYGMNFENMPELSWSFGYLGVFVLAIAISVVCIGIFKKKKWF